ncbi:MAG: phosphoglucosamine mutase [Ponticaulis sp.]|nr:phosphoglucosamine mutase [Ponticaulis sp.]
MAEALFGTDGIRGRVNEGAIRADMFVRFGEALGFVLRQLTDSRDVLIGRDTRQSGAMIQSAIEAGLFNSGMNVVRTGIVPTPAVGHLTRETNMAAGLMITASHNQYQDNGVKVFGADGFKLSSEAQEQIESLIQNRSIDCSVDVAEMGTPLERPDLADVYIQHARQSVPPGINFRGMKICLDAANGAGSHLAAHILSELGADVLVSGSDPNGQNINLDCGALHPEGLQARVVQEGANIGIAFDGDADRIIIVDEKGTLVDGDQIMGAIALDYARKGKLSGKTVVATVMSNLGLEAVLKQNGIALERTKVGDRYVVESMREHGFCVGGEQSGHIILTEHVTTGDAIIAALQILEIIAFTGKPASEVLTVFEPVPQVLKNVRYQSEDPLNEPGVATLLTETEEKLGDQGRLVVRKSGTEPVIRVMVEAYSEEQAESSVDAIISAIQKLDE